MTIVFAYKAKSMLFSGNFVLSDLPPFTRSFLLPRQSLHLHAMLSSCGVQHERGDYDWDGLRRGRAELALLQVTLAGEGRLRYQDRTLTVKPGDVMLLHFPHDHRYWRPAEVSCWSLAYVVMHGQMVLDAWQHLERQAGPLLPLDLQGPTARLLEALLERAAGNSLRSAFEVSALAWQMVMTLAEEILPRQPQSSQPPFVQAVRRYCRDHLHEPIGVADMARTAGYSRAHFSRAFSEAVGQTPAAYLRHRRIRRAMHLLQTSSASIAEIARRCGFRDSSYFSKVFSQEVRMPPTEFRRTGM